MSIKNKHKFHLVAPSPWPILTSFSLFFFLLGLIFYIKDLYIGSYIFFCACIALCIILCLWWKDVINEGIQGYHSANVKTGLKIGVVIFFLSEICLFGSFFSSYFFSKINPMGTLLEGIWVSKTGIWPPENIQTINPWDLPLMNTIILLLSSNTVTWAIFAIEHKDKKDSSLALLLTVILGILFLSFQIYEYYHANFAMKDGIYGSNFYIITGFHGLHVLIGTIFLFICYLRTLRGDFLRGDHLGAEFAAWYWHFVDLIWLFLFVFMYVFDA